MKKVMEQAEQKKRRRMTVLTGVWAGLVALSGYFNMKTNAYPTPWFVPMGVWVASGVAMAFTVLVMIGYIRIYTMRGYDILVLLDVVLFVLPFVVPISLGHSLFMGVAFVCYAFVLFLGFIYLYVKRKKMTPVKKWIVIVCVILSVLLPVLLVEA
ncbi:hypothetical protein LJC56_11765 [Christensenellaceae bacterium OttesenSCG-928-K19]|nr:hypothetical protein [Christensenellaceae bacterium OttesenSCG-928-K19]